MSSISYCHEISTPAQNNLYPPLQPQSVEKSSQRQVSCFVSRYLMSSLVVSHESWSQLVTFQSLPLPLPILISTTCSCQSSVQTLSHIVSDIVSPGMIEREKRGHQPVPGCQSTLASVVMTSAHSELTSLVLAGVLQLPSAAVGQPGHGSTPRLRGQHPVLRQIKKC